VPRYRAGAEIYAVADRFVDSCLRRDDSLFTPGRSIWSLANLDELDRRYIQNPELGSATFEEKLRGQLEGASADAYQLMAEVLYLYYLPAGWNIAGNTKRQKTLEVLSWSPAPVALPDDLSAVLDHKIGSGGPGFHLFKWASLVFLITFARRWKQASPDARSEALGDPWLFRDFVAQIPTEGGGVYGREALLHLVFPDTFERTFSRQDKWRLANALRDLVDDPEANVDRRISQIRAKLEHRFGPDFEFYETDGVRALWKRFDSPLDEFIYWGSRFFQRPSFDADERDYKLDIITRLSEAKTALLSGEDWLPVLKRAFTTRNNLTAWQVHDTFLKWCQEDVGAAERLLRRLWNGSSDPLARLGDFFGHFPREVVSGLGGRTTLGSFLMLAIDPYSYPPYRVAAMHAAYRLTGEEFGEEKDEVAMYRRGLAFFDRLRERGEERGLRLRDRLDAQAVVWCITNYPAPEDWPAEDRAAFDRYRQAIPDPEDEVEGGEDETIDEGPVVQPSADPLIALSEELLFQLDALREIDGLLRAKGQLIFYGPPGTGKTFVARKFAAALAGDPGRVRLVQFHPSYAYEDFVEGYRPRLFEDRHPGFGLVSGPLKGLADRASADPGHDYFLIIDELNRGNIAKVFGELYFLLEYRDEEIHLQYSDVPFRLPPNLRLIGTMNTADRSIALLDAALRRRFSFVPFFPDRKPVAGLLERWLQRHRPDMLPVARIVDRANLKLADRNAAIGPSFFLRADLDDKRLALIWQHEIMPLLEDYFFEAPERVKEFDLATLRREVMAAAATYTSEETLPALAVAEEAADYSSDDQDETDTADDGAADSA
jgi:5-methylcytosine-specific restriction enzyme B